MQTRDRSLADDLAQQVVMRALDRADQFTPGTHLNRWLFTIARRLWLNDRRREAVREGEGQVDADSVDLRDGGPSPEVNIFTRQVLSIIDALPEGQRLAVLMVYCEGYSYREAADALDVPVGTIMSRLSTARQRVRKDVLPGDAKKHESVLEGPQ